MKCVSCVLCPILTGRGAAARIRWPRCWRGMFDTTLPPLSLGEGSQQTQSKKNTKTHTHTLTSKQNNIHPRLSFMRLVGTAARWTNEIITSIAFTTCGEFMRIIARPYYVTLSRVFSKYEGPEFSRVEMESLRSKQKAAGRSAPLITTPSMLKSFIFSKPAEALTSFTSWNSAVNAQNASAFHVAEREQERNAMGKAAGSAGASNDAGGHSPSGVWRRASAGSSSLPAVATNKHQHRHHEQPDHHNDQAFDLGAARRAMTTAWKRRSFVDNVKDIPLMYQHKSVVPAVPISPRTQQTHQRPGSSPGGASNSNRGNAPLAAGVIPLSESLGQHHRPSTADSHPVKTAVARVGHPFEESERSHQEHRRHLAARVVHLTTCSRRADATVVYPGRGLYGTHLYRPATAEAPHDAPRNATGIAGGELRWSSAHLRQDRPRSKQDDESSVMHAGVDDTQPPQAAAVDGDVSAGRASSPTGSQSMSSTPTSASSPVQLRRRRPQEKLPDQE